MVVVEQYQYKKERTEILRGIKNYHEEQGNDPVKFLRDFLNDLTIAIHSIRNEPFLSPDFPFPVKKKLFSKGKNQSVILYLLVPINHQNDTSKIKEIYLTSIMLTQSGNYNEYVKGKINLIDF